MTESTDRPKVWIEAPNRELALRFAAALSAAGLDAAHAWMFDRAPTRPFGPMTRYLSAVDTQQFARDSVGALMQADALLVLFDGVEGYTSAYLVGVAAARGIPVVLAGGLPPDVFLVGHGSAHPDRQISLDPSDAVKALLRAIKKDKTPPNRPTITMTQREILDARPLTPTQTGDAHATAHDDGDSKGRAAGRADGTGEVRDDRYDERVLGDGDGI